MSSKAQFPQCREKNKKSSSVDFPFFIRLFIEKKNQAFLYFSVSSLFFTLIVVPCKKRMKNFPTPNFVTDGFGIKLAVYTICFLFVL